MYRVCDRSLRYEEVASNIRQWHWDLLSTGMDAVILAWLHPLQL